MTGDRRERRAAKGPRRRDVHVCADPDRRRWIVIRRGRALSRHRSQAAAVRAGARAARRHAVDLVTHGRDGRIRSKDSYGNESSRRDTEH